MNFERITSVAIGRTLLVLGALFAGASTFAQTVPITWRMATSWPEKLPLLHATALDFAESVSKASGGRLTIEVVGPSQHGIPGDLLRAVEDSKFDLAHTTAHYYAAQVPAIDFFTTLPFGLTADENHAWLNEGGGQALFESVLAPRGILPLTVGNTSVQMGGWFAKEIKNLDDLAGVRMRISGFPGRVMARLGVVPVSMPIGEIIPAFEAGRIDAAEAVVPALDMMLPFEKHAPYQYEPWHEPDAAMHVFISRKRFDALPEDLQFIVRQVAQASALRSVTRGLDNNASALTQLKARGASVRPWPTDVLQALQQATEQEVLAISNPEAKSVATSLLAYKAKVADYSQQTTGSVLRTR